MTPEESQSAFAALIAGFGSEPGVSWDEGKGFGSGALKINGKIFAMVTSKGQLVLKLPRTRVEGLIMAGFGHAFDPGHERRMKEWLAFTHLPDDLLDLGREALNFVRR